ncbi:hypothetical protein Brms1b_011553 [Colletotrichum noveboracense]|nr:hypothetical protein Brms1b_011553 [Colletotrichum noveboracense]
MADNKTDVRIPRGPKTEEARKCIIAAAGSPEATVLTPQWRLGHLAHSYFVSRAQHMAVEWDIPQLLADSGPMHLDTLASKTGIVDTNKLGLVMRMLCAHHIFSETALGIFANDEASTALATDERLANTVRYASFLFPTADVLPSLLKDPVLCASYAPRDSAFSKTIGKGMGQFEFLNNDFVGIVQDQPGMIEHATAHWQKTDPRALATGAVKLTTHDFFNENPVKGADVYWFRSVIVDWHNEDLITMFTHIKNAMTPGKSRLLIGEYMMHPTCGDTMLPNAPPPLLKNYGEFQAMGLIGGFVLTLA